MPNGHGEQDDSAGQCRKGNRDLEKRACKQSRRGWDGERGWGSDSHSDSDKLKPHDNPLHEGVKGTA